MYNYFNFNGVQVNDLAIVTKIEKPYIPGRTIDTINITSRDGEIFNGMKFNSIKIPISLAIIGNSEDDYKQRVKILKDIFSIGREVPISFAPYVSIWGMVNSDFKVTRKNVFTGITEIEILCTNPYSYSDYTLTYNSEGASKLLKVGQKGGTKSYPLISVGITKDTHFIQVENTSTKEKILVGSYPNLEISNTTAESSIILHDNCQSLSALTITGANIDGNRSNTGSFAISTDGSSYTLGNMGDGSTTYKGACGRVNLSKELDEFEIKVNIYADSTGKNGDPNYFDPDTEHYKEEVQEGSKTTYYVVNCTGLNYRTGPSTSYPSKGTLPKGYEIRSDYSFENGWCKFPYNNGTYYCSGKYLTEMIEDNTKSVLKDTNISIENVLVLPDEGTKSNAQRAVYDAPGGKVVGYIPYGTVIRVLIKTYNQTDSEGNVKNSYYYMWKPYINSKGENVQGYIEKSVILRSIDNVNNAIDYSNDPGYADDKTGIGEIYGFDVNGTQLFKMSVFDDNPYFEYTQPQIRVGNKTVLKDDAKAPEPKQRNIASQNGVTTSYYLGGEYGAWNKGNIHLTLARKKSGSNYVWHAEAYKEENGIITKTLYSKNNRDTNFPTEKLNYLAIYIGTSTSNMNKCACIAIEDIVVTSGDKQSSDTPSNITYFKQGDVIDIDCENSNCYVNRQLRNDLVDIGSSYFGVEPGYTEITLNSDDTNASLSVSVKEKWLGIVDDDVKSNKTKVENKGLYVEPYKID